MIKCNKKKYNNYYINALNYVLLNCDNQKFEIKCHENFLSGKREQFSVTYF